MLVELRGMLNLPWCFLPYVSRPGKPRVRKRAVDFIDKARGVEFLPDVYASVRAPKSAAGPPSASLVVCGNSSLIRMSAAYGTFDVGLTLSSTTSSIS